MISFMKNLWDSLDAEKQKLELQKKLDQEHRYLDDAIEKEEKERDLLPASRMQSIISAAAECPRDREEALKLRSDQSSCYKKTGIVTTLKANHGTIDHAIFFDINAALSVFAELKVGCRVEYLAFQQMFSDHIKVVKIEQVIDENWDEALPTEKKIELQIAELKNEQPKYFNTHQRNILGLITERKRDSILIDTDYKTMNINLDSVEIDFVPQEGDRVYVCCNVQSDEHFVDRQGEILQEVSVHPARLLKQEKCTVRRVHSDWGVLNDDCYFTFGAMATGCQVNVGDIVAADLIECERGEYVWRCIKLNILEHRSTDSPLKSQIMPSTGNNNNMNNSNNSADTPSQRDNHSVSVSEDARCIFTATFQSQTIEMTVTNNRERTIKILNIEFPGRRRDSQIKLIKPDILDSLELLGGSSLTLHFEAESKHYGESRETFVIVFDKFRVRRSIRLVVCEDEAAAAVARANVNANNGSSYGDRGGQRSRYYAHQVWSRKSEVIPGVGRTVKRRFIAQRIGFYEVPERLRRLYLTLANKQEVLEEIETMFPAIKEDLRFANYVTRFQTLIYLEEIEYFISFRAYDRERAHFQRDGEFLSLAIENLAERRPSLVLGDTIRAINPWNDKDSRSYDGVIHKVLFDRVLVKFNAGFHTKYNGEDYRLEFYFSRFGFRKQHFAVQQIVKHLGEHFLFPSKVRLRENLQLAAKLDDKDAGGVLYLDGKICPWFNPNLNHIQKHAICNVLRGEAQNMPYVIFGPPGTGKTMTLVETILQLVKNIPSARLLVGAPSNSSADLIATRLINSDVLQPGDFIRLVSQNQIEKELIPEHLMTYCATIDIAADGTCDDSMITTESGLKLRCQMKYLGRHRVTISTCSTLGNFLQMGFPAGHFTHVLIDESGQCTEPEAMVVICQVSKVRGQVILAGDPHQLQAIVINRYASDRGYSLSFLERILQRAPYLRDVVRFPETSGFDSRLVTKLLYNYRALPSILNVYNDLFYNSELLPMVDERDSREAKMLIKLDMLLPSSETRDKSHGVFFYGIRSENKQDKDSPSWYNPLEARNVFLMTIKLYRQNIQPEDIGIITPYTKQVKILRTLFIEADIAMPKIGSVEEFQGQERDIILISTVRSTQRHIVSDLRHSLGFVQSSKRMNVAISRPRYLIFIFGNPHLLALDHCWRAYIKYCVDNDAYLGCDLPEIFNAVANNVNEEGKN